MTGDYVVAPHLVKFIITIIVIIPCSFLPYMKYLHQKHLVLYWVTN